MPRLGLGNLSGVFFLTEFLIFRVIFAAGLSRKTKAFRAA